MFNQIINRAQSGTIDAITGRYKYVFAAIAIVIVIYYIMTYNNSAYEEFMYGLWTADDDFCSQSGISSMLLFIGPPIYSSWYWLTGSVSRAGYVIICDDISNQSFKIDYKTGYGGIGAGKYNINATFEFDTDDIFEREGAPVTMSFDVIKGTLKIHAHGPNGEKVYARMYKQNDISDLLAIDGAADDVDAHDIAMTTTPNAPKNIDDSLSDSPMSA